LDFPGVPEYKKKSEQLFFGTTLTKRGYIFASTCDSIFHAESVKLLEISAAWPWQHPHCDIKTGAPQDVRPVNSRGDIVFRSMEAVDECNNDFEL
jgi:hypothetical protein